MISFVGAGPGAHDLITIRGADRLADADVVIWASSLVSPALLERCRDTVVLHDSKTMTLETVTAVFAAHPDANIVRLHSGDPAVYGAIAEQIAWCVEHERPFEIVPGVTSMAAAAAATGCELTVPGVAQSVVMTRLAHRTAASMPTWDGQTSEGIAEHARTGATLAVFLSAARPDELVAELLAPGSRYTPSTPVVIASRVTWPDEQIVHSSVGTLACDLRELDRTTTVLIMVGDALGVNRTGSSQLQRSHVYAPDYAHSFRAAESSTDA